VALYSEKYSLFNTTLKIVYIQIYRIHRIKNPLGTVLTCGLDGHLLVDHSRRHGEVLVGLAPQSFNSPN